MFVVFYDYCFDMSVFDYYGVVENGYFGYVVIFMLGYEVVLEKIVLFC